jgi:site-specific DNA-methyltransferase (adenine-specific)
MSPLPNVELHHGDCLEVLARLPAESIDAVVTDPPYGLHFDGLEWDAPWKATHRAAEHGVGFQRWVQMWATECLRVLKPGGHLLAFGGSRTWHRLAAGIEDSGFHVRDSIAWIYATGQVKSNNLTAAIARVDPEAAARHAGLGTTLKPAFEPCVVARKPFKGTVAGNVIAHGVGGLNIDQCRTPGEDGEPDRWPANVGFDTASAEMFDRDSAGVSDRRDGHPSRSFPVFRYQPKPDNRERVHVRRRTMRLREDLSPAEREYVTQELASTTAEGGNACES